jgi:putative RecB family exonuclease
MQSKTKAQNIDYSRVYSPSKLNLFGQCPKAYHFSYLDPVYRRMKYKLQKMPEFIWKFHTLGKAVHNAITFFYYLKPEERTKKNLPVQLKKTWVSEAMPNKKMPLGEWGGFKSLEEEREAYREALKMLKNFYQLAEIEPEIKYLPTKDFANSIEDYKDLITPLSEDFSISGKFDLVIRSSPDALQVIDFKTSKSEEADEFQLEFYKALAEERFEERVEKASLYFLRTANQKDFAFKDVSTAVIKDEIMSRINRILSEREFEPKPSKLCKFCLFQTFCPAKEKVKEMVETTKGEDFSDDLPF